MAEKIHNSNGSSPQSVSLVKRVKDLCLFQTIGACLVFVCWGSFIVNAFSKCPGPFVFLLTIFTGLYVSTAMRWVNSMWNRKDFWGNEPTTWDDLLEISEKLKSYMRGSLFKWLEKKAKEHEADVPKHEEAKVRRGETTSTLLGLSMAEKMHTSNGSSPHSESLVKQIKKLCVLQTIGANATFVFWGMFIGNVFPECPGPLVFLLTLFVGLYVSIAMQLVYSIRNDKFGAENKGENMKGTCLICLEDVYVNDMFPIDGCQHSYCRCCIKKHTEVKLLEGKLPICPHKRCNIELKIETFKKLFNPELYDWLTQRLKEASIPAKDKIYCPNPKCSFLMTKAEALTSANTVGASKCVKCRRRFCMKCKVLWHNYMSCKVYKKLYPFPCGEDAKLVSLTTKKLWRQCVMCKNVIELAQGCYHIYCRCGYEFCYTCGAEWKENKATCKCPIWDERNIIYN